MTTYDYAVIGGGIVGLATAMQLSRKFPAARIVLLEKESGPAKHQTGRNSGVIHSGVYYKPGSFKARFAHQGAQSMVRFCNENEIPHEVCGKVIVATSKSELPALESLFQRGMQNNVPLEKLSPERVRELEPHVNCVAGISVKSTGITCYTSVSRKYLQKFEANGGVTKFETEVQRFFDRGSVKVIETHKGDYEAKFVINCGGLFSDRLARDSGTNPHAQIVPFRGEYYELIPERRSLVQGLIYPVPNPEFPFLGVHFTRMIDGSVHAGPNAVLAFSREGYHKSDFNARDLSETLTFSGFWKLAGRNAGEGIKELYRSFSKAAFTRSLQKLIPALKAEDLIPCKAGVRAQALTRDGKLVDDFLIIPGHRSLHVCNAPSPAATASLEIGKEIARRVPSVGTEQVRFIP